MDNFEKQQALEAAKLAETDIIKLMNSDTQYISPCRICDDMFETTDRTETCCEDCRLPNGKKLETIENVFHATIGTYESSDLVICEMCGQTFSTSYENEDYCQQCRNS